MPLKVQGHTVPHLKALNNGKLESLRLGFSNISRIFYLLFKILILVLKTGFAWFVFSATVYLCTAYFGEIILGTMVYLINMQHVLLIFWKNQACMVLLHPACFINFGKNSSLHGLLHPISSENHHSSHYFASKLTLMVKNWMECSLKTYSFNHMMS